MEVKSDQTCVRRLSFDVSSELQIYWFHYSFLKASFFLTHVHFKGLKLLNLVSSIYLTQSILMTVKASIKAYVWKAGLGIIY